MVVSLCVLIVVVCSFLLCMSLNAVVVSEVFFFFVCVYLCVWCVWVVCVCVRLWCVWLCCGWLCVCVFVFVCAFAFQ